MTWTNKLFNILLLNSLSGGMIYGIWLLVKKYLSAKKNKNLSKLCDRFTNCKGDFCCKSKLKSN